ncbi:glycosyltransferase family 2 protein [Nocardioides yefusunii]|uniref:Glycosyltransferase family 2 protein n=1 Tax=Nocardioides yefusunii TaxID=2500546 RepID=A0ABW1R0Z7_9ACTN|nr:glycosyltransferase [Nocardioides yefusunii]
MTRVRHNDWRPLTPPALGEWTPTKTVSVVLPAWGGRDLSPVMAALAAQTYPAHLMEVVVVDDGNPVPVVLPELRPENSRVIRVTEGWGRAGATQLGMDATDGEIMVWLDDDMLPFAEHVEAHARWHHLNDFTVVMGVKRFVDPEITMTPQQVHDAVADGSIASLHDWDTATPHTWIDEIWESTDDLVTAGTAGFRCFVSATASMSRAMVDAAGGMRTSMRLGEDTEYGHKLAQAGGLLVPEYAAKAWHLGNSHAMEHAENVIRYNQPAFADHVPTLRSRRAKRGRVYAVPYLQVVLPTTGSLREVMRSADAVLDSDLTDVQVLLVGAWDQIHDGRVSPLKDPLRDLGVLYRRYVNDPRVRLVTPDDAALSSRPEAVHRLVVAGNDRVPVAGALRAWTEDADRSRNGLRIFVDGDLDDGAVPYARLERISAFARVEWTDGDFFSRPASVQPSPLDVAVAEAFGAATVPVKNTGWVHWRRRVVPRERRHDIVQMDAAESWRLALESLGLAERPALETPGRPVPVAVADSLAGAVKERGQKALRRLRRR